MAWGSEQSFTDQTVINNSVEEFLEAVTLNPYEVAHVQLKIDNEHASAVTDALQISVYTTIDATSEVWDTDPFMRFEYKPSTINAEYKSLLIMGVRKFRFGALSKGATNTYTFGGTYMLNGVSA